MMVEISEMTMTSPGSQMSTGLPHYPWSPSEIEALPERERRLYLKNLQDVREEWQKAAADVAAKMKR